MTLGYIVDHWITQQWDNTGTVDQRILIAFSIHTLVCYSSVMPNAFNAQ